MKSDFQISAISYEVFEHLFELNQEVLSQAGGVKMTVDQYPGYPCRVSLEDASIGEEVILIPYEHHAVSSPYQASGPLFIRKNANPSDLKVNEIPSLLHHRLLSLRVYDKKAMMMDAGTTTIKGTALQETIIAILQNPTADYIQIHNASPGCYICQVNRVKGDFKTK